MKYNHGKGLLTPQIIANCEDGMLKSAVKNSLYSLTSTQSNPAVAIVAILERVWFLSAESHLWEKTKTLPFLESFLWSKSLYLISGLITHLQYKTIKKGNFLLYHTWHTFPICSHGDAMTSTSWKFLWNRNKLKLECDVGNGHSSEEPNHHSTCSWWVAPQLQISNSQCRKRSLSLSGNRMH